MNMTELYDLAERIAEAFGRNWSIDPFNANTDLAILLQGDEARFKLEPAPWPASNRDPDAFRIAAVDEYGEERLSPEPIQAILSASNKTPEQLAQDIRMRLLHAARGYYLHRVQYWADRRRWVARMNRALRDFAAACGDEAQPFVQRSHIDSLMRGDPHFALWSALLPFSGSADLLSFRLNIEPNRTSSDASASARSILGELRIQFASPEQMKALLAALGPLLVMQARTHLAQLAESDWLCDGCPTQQGTHPGREMFYCPACLKTYCAEHAPAHPALCCGDEFPMQPLMPPRSPVSTED